MRKTIENSSIYRQTDRGYFRVKGENLLAGRLSQNLWKRLSFALITNGKFWVWNGKLCEFLNCGYFSMKFICDLELKRFLNERRKMCEKFTSWSMAAQRLSRFFKTNPLNFWVNYDMAMNWFFTRTAPLANLMWYLWCANLSWLYLTCMPELYYLYSRVKLQRHSNYGWTIRMIGRNNVWSKMKKLWTFSQINKQ